VPALRSFPARLQHSLPGRIGHKFVDDRGPNWAVIIAWNALFAMFPLVLGLASILGLVLNFAGITAAKLYVDMVSVFPDPSTRAAIEQALEAVKHQTGILGAVGLLGLFWAGAGLFGTMEKAFAVVYGTRPRPFVRQKLMGFLMMLLFSALVALVLGTSTVLPALKDVPFLPGVLRSGVAAVAVQVVTGVVSGCVLFGAIYTVVPNRRMRLRQVLPGAVVAGVLFELVTLLFPLYLEVNRGIDRYGSTFALLFLLMTFAYVVGLVTVLGVEVNSVLHPLGVSRAKRQPQR
jgi:membrane protein